MKSLEYRRAKDENIPQILTLQERIFSNEQNIPVEFITEFLQWHPLFWCALNGNTVIAAAALWQEKGETHGGRFVTDEKYRGRHIGTQLAEMSFSDLFSHGTKQIFVEAREITASIVSKNGGRIMGKPRQFYLGTVTPLVLEKEHYTGRY